MLVGITSAAAQRVTPLTKNAGATDLITGTVVQSQAGWTAGASRIVTRSVIRDAAGNEHLVHQPGGTVQGIGMRVIPSPTLLQVGEHVQVTTRALANASSSAIIQVVTQRTPASPPPGALWGVRTTNAAGAPLRWSSGCVLITYDSSGTSHLAGDQEFDVIDAVFNHWASQMASCSYMSFDPQGRADMEVGLDGVNLIKFRDDEWCPPDAESPADCYSPGAAGLTTLFFIDDDSSSRNGVILDADIELNAVNFAVSDGGSSLGSPACLSDLANTLTHEVGHLLGLDHTCWVPVNADDVQPVDHTGALVPRCFPAGSLPQYVTEATMYNFQECGETKKATLHEDDVQDGVCLIYPLVDDPAECKPADLGGGGGCAGTGGQHWPLALALLGLLMWRRRARYGTSL